MRPDPQREPRPLTTGAAISINGDVDMRGGSRTLLIYGGERARNTAHPQGCATCPTAIFE
jgi:hypothetical protein